MRAYGVSVEKVEEGLKALEYPGVATVQIIFNVFRQRPAELFFRQAVEPRRRRDRARPARLGPADREVRPRHRASLPTTTGTYNRHGESFDVGETFAGVDFETRPRGRRGAPSARAGRRRPWRSSHCAGSSTSTPCRRVIPGAKTPTRLVRTPRRPTLPPLSDEIHDADRRRLSGGASRRRSHQRW